LATAYLLDGDSGTHGKETTTTGYTITFTSSTTVDQWLPSGKIGGGNYLYVWSGGASGTDNTNYFGLSAVTQVPLDRAPLSNPGLTVQQAYAMDAKVDDGYPQVGRVTALYYNNAVVTQGAAWAAGGGAQGASPGAAAPGSSTTCYDNGNNATNPMQYSLEINNGSNTNCALSFRMQAGD
jgi:hypothetical protein